MYVISPCRETSYVCETKMNISQDEKETHTLYLRKIKTKCCSSRDSEYTYILVCLGMTTSECVCFSSEDDVYLHSLFVSTQVEEKFTCSQTHIYTLAVFSRLDYIRKFVYQK